MNEARGDGLLGGCDADLNGDGLPDVVGGRSEASATVVLTGD